MKIALIIILVLAAVIFVLMSLPLRLFISYERDDGKNEARLTLKYIFFKVCLFDSSAPKKKKKDKPKKKEPSFDKEKGKIERYINIFSEIKEDAGEVLDYLSERAAVFEKIDFDMSFGFFDAMQTGIFTGVINGFVYSILGFIHHRSHLEEMKVNIQPVFENPCLFVKTNCIIRLKNVHIIIVAVKVLKILKKIRKIERSI